VGLNAAAGQGGNRTSRQSDHLAKLPGTSRPGRKKRKKGVRHPVKYWRGQRVPQRVEELGYVYVLSAVANEIPTDSSWTTAEAFTLYLQKTPIPLTSCGERIV